MTIKQQFKQAITTKSLTELKGLVIWTGIQGTVKIAHQKSAQLAPESFNGLYLVHIKPDKSRVSSSFLANITTKLNYNCGLLDGYEIKLVDNFDTVYQQWVNLNEDHRYRKLYQEAHLDSSNGGVEIDYPAAKKRMIKFGEKNPNDKYDVSMMDLRWRLFRKNMTDRFGGKIQ